MKTRAWTEQRPCDRGWYTYNPTSHESITFTFLASNNGAAFARNHHPGSATVTHLRHAVVVREEHGSFKYRHQADKWARPIVRDMKKERT